jgi:hypothetical protein
LEGVPVEPGDVIALELPIDSRPVRVRARVARVDDRVDEPTYNVAVAFQDVAWDDICAIARYLAPQI